LEGALVSLLDLIRKRQAELNERVNWLQAYEEVGEGSSTSRELDLAISEMEFLAELVEELVPRPFRPSE
jgi:hypothetical protein